MRIKSPPAGYLNPVQYAKKHSVTTNLVTSWIHGGKLPYIKRGDCRFIKEDEPLPPPPAIFERVEALPPKQIHLEKQSSAYTKKVAINVPEAIDEWARAIAEVENRKITNVYVEAMRDYIQKFKRNHEINV